MPNAQQASRRMRSQSSARVFKKDDSARRWSRQWEMRARARVQRWELLAYKNGRSFEKLKKKCFRNVVRGRELPRELLNSLNDISSTCWRGENGLRVFRITNSVFFRLSEACQEGSTLAWLTHLAEQRVERVLWKFMTKWEWMLDEVRGRELPRELLNSPAPAEEVRMAYVCLELQIPLFSDSVKWQPAISCLRARAWIR